MKLFYQKSNSPYKSSEPLSAPGDLSLSARFSDGSLLVFVPDVSGDKKKTVKLINILYEIK